ncbi:hypothetical protein AYO45_02730 [Gammaproteobacteria bacterium SCGC AG-212-F23]|nr:hypothetical protein AYO45_02730 [Gammaproteobacteria bacterium SCGC AG-212-F23]
MQYYVVGTPIDTKKTVPQQKFGPMVGRKPTHLITQTEMEASFPAPDEKNQTVKVFANKAEALVYANSFNKFEYTSDGVCGTEATLFQSQQCTIFTVAADLPDEKSKKSVTVTPIELSEQGREKTRGEGLNNNNAYAAPLPRLLYFYEIKPTLLLREKVELAGDPDVSFLLKTAYYTTYENLFKQGIAKIIKPATTSTPVVAINNSTASTTATTTAQPATNPSATVAATVTTSSTIIDDKTIPVTSPTASTIPQPTAVVTVGSPPSTSANSMASTAVIISNPTETIAAPITTSSSVITATLANTASSTATSNGDMKSPTATLSKDKFTAGFNHMVTEGYDVWVAWRKHRPEARTLNSAFNSGGMQIHGIHQRLAEERQKLVRSGNDEYGSMLDVAWNNSFTPAAGK